MAEDHDSSVARNTHKSPRRARRINLTLSYPALLQRVTFTTPEVQTLYQVAFNAANASLGKIVKLRVNEGVPESIHQLETLYRGILDERKNTLETERARIRALIEENGIDAEIDHSEAIEFHARLTTPWSRGYLELYRLLDAALLDLRLLWLAEIIDTPQFQRDVKSLRRLVLGVRGLVISAVNTAFQEASVRDGGETSGTPEGEAAPTPKRATRKRKTTSDDGAKPAPGEGSPAGDGGTPDETGETGKAGEGDAPPVAGDSQSSTESAGEFPLQ